MGAKTGITWTNSTWTPIRARNLQNKHVGWHCEHVSPGCVNCYAETLNKRHGTNLEFKPGHRKDVEIFLDQKLLNQPLTWRDPRMIFVCSMTDLFADFVPDEFIDQMFEIMGRTLRHTFQILTKRPARMKGYMLNREFEGEPTLPNVWLGVSAEDQEHADERIPDLLKTPAVVRFVSYEPALGPIDFRDWLRPVKVYEGGFEDDLEAPRIDWIIFGGESGPGYRKCDIGWAYRSMIQCREAGTKFFFKQDSHFRNGKPGIASQELQDCKEFPDRYVPPVPAAAPEPEPQPTFL